jgi:sterol desaturase/sphingolipid hydroxylase (fatty acid hydroxylase superfamily)
MEGIIQVFFELSNIHTSHDLMEAGFPSSQWFSQCHYLHHSCNANAKNVASTVIL